ncbi:biotin synthesis protein BioC [Fusobacterium vincentii ATCC 51190]|uniref:Malonyl-ACP O-methyltransferase BioC n=1 Tax=Fusobacterium vincentii TaxID=155615 RepID=A0AAJ1CRZ5_FUSVC|nr:MULTISPECIES: malonyl-ACP O-methyltransferase BioC [Fusobacterium]ETT04743.1 malonyl-acyl carrier protein O-methyltransferase BioC [Fusobacterium sp. CM21]EJG09967.1 biotin synthesis protein BioC [Fusobacterium vincentii ATCC 51190]ERT45697.1 biotin biosynthesis protein BioC [Fusobacterium nucleatum CTI-7]MCW0263175.1 malonyl-ACP O-methyltransferase BioC [Fusobacterium vincentii]OHU81166.1 malonyl-[acyl-carrier protein] O-methyltransferase BioC [Fusobacterium nucleatum]
MNFNKHYNVYEKYSLAQKQVAKNLLDYMGKSNIFNTQINSIFEIGCGTGIFTKEYRKYFLHSDLILNDIFDVREFIKDIDYNIFIQENIEELDIPKSDLVVSSSVFQWIKDKDSLIRNIAENTDNLCFSSYVSGNLIEIKNHFDISLDYLNIEEFKEILKKYFSSVKYYSETIKLDFEDPMAVLKHLKYTGVTGFQKTSISKIKAFKDNILTYEVAYFICKK